METDSQPQTFYAGNFRHSIDEKHRLTIPWRWRRGEAEEFIMLPEPRGEYLLVMSPEAFAKMNADVETNRTMSAAERRGLLRQMHAGSPDGRPEKHGRLVLPDRDW